MPPDHCCHNLQVFFELQIWAEKLELCHNHLPTFANWLNKNCELWQHWSCKSMFLPFFKPKKTQLLGWPAEGTCWTAWWRSWCHSRSGRWRRWWERDGRLEQVVAAKAGEVWRFQDRVELWEPSRWRQLSADVEMGAGGNGDGVGQGSVVLNQTH